MLGKGIATDAFAPVLRFASQHLASQLRLAKKARSGGFRPSAVTLQQFDHFPVALIVGPKDRVMIRFIDSTNGKPIFEYPR